MRASGEAGAVIQAELQAARHAKASSEEELFRAQAALKSAQEAAASREEQYKEVEGLRVKQSAMEQAVYVSEAERRHLQLEAELAQSRSQSHEDIGLLEVRFDREMEDSRLEMASSRESVTRLELELATALTKAASLESENASSRVELDKHLAVHDAKVEATRGEMDRLREALQGKEGEALAAERRGQEALHQKREELIVSEREARRDLERLKEELAETKASLASSVGRGDALQEEVGRWHAKEATREEMAREEAAKAGEAPRASVAIRSVLSSRADSLIDSPGTGGGVNPTSSSSRLEELPTVEETLDQEGLGTEGVSDFQGSDLCDQTTVAWERISTMSLRLRAAMGEVSGCLKQIDGTLCRDWNDRPEKALENIQKELRVANGSRNLSLICLEELFGAGKATRTKGGLVGGLLASTAQTVKEAEEAITESADKARFLSEDNARLEADTAHVKRDKLDSLAAKDAQWTELNRRLQSRKMTSDLLARKLQGELIHLTVEMKRLVLEKESLRERQESTLCHQREAREEVHEGYPTSGTTSQDILAELANAGEAVSFGSYGAETTE